MAKVTIEVLDAVVDGKGKGEKLSVEEASAKHLESVGYAKVVKAETKTAPKAKPKAKSTAKKDEGDK